MPSDESGAGLTSRRTLLAGLGTAGAVGVGTGLGYRVLSRRIDDTEVTRRLAVADEFSVDETGLESADDGDRDDQWSPPAGHRCDPNPGRIDSTSHTAHFSMIDAWNERYHLWRSDGDGADDGGDDGPGVSVQNSIALEKAPERVDGSYLYGVRVYSLAHVEDGRLSRHRLRRMESELVAHPDVEIRTVLPASPIEPDSGVCTLSLVTELPSGWNAGYERTTWTNDGTVDADHDGDANGVTLSFAGDSSMIESMIGLLELRTDRPLAEFETPFTWTVRGSATHRGL